MGFYFVLKYIILDLLPNIYKSSAINARGSAFLRPPCPTSCLLVNGNIHKMRKKKKKKRKINNVNGAKTKRVVSECLSRLSTHQYCKTKPIWWHTTISKPSHALPGQLGQSHSTFLTVSLPG